MKHVAVSSLSSDHHAPLIIHQVYSINYHIPSTYHYTASATLMYSNNIWVENQVPAQKNLEVQHPSGLDASGREVPNYNKRWHANECPAPPEVKNTDADLPQPSRIKSILNRKKALTEGPPIPMPINDRPCIQVKLEAPENMRNENLPAWYQHWGAEGAELPLSDHIEGDSDPPVSNGE
ncbi:hypothetical protein K438DRAFT_1770058 [Mycena galopus ATCC 62051]|nr:hypothetical protein K438DRAFT_1770058 [Mycena galopus ATCC 62051]